jgi:hypothetical protein
VLLHRRRHTLDLRFERKERFRRLAVDDPGLDQIDDSQRGQHGQQSGDDIEQECLDPEAAEVAARAEARDPGDDRCRNEWHHDHLQHVEEDGAEELE